jgi:hypothetical protein
VGALFYSSFFSQNAQGVFAEMQGEVSLYAESTCAYWSLHSPISILRRNEQYEWVIKLPVSWDNVRYMYSIGNAGLYNLTLTNCESPKADPTKTTPLSKYAKQ